MGAIGVIAIAIATVRWATSREVTSATFLAAGAVYAQVDHDSPWEAMRSTICRRLPGRETMGWCRTLPDGSMTSSVVGDATIVLATIGTPHGDEVWVLDAMDGGTITTWALPTRHGALDFARHDALLVVTSGGLVRALDVSARDTLWTLPAVDGERAELEGDTLHLGTRLVDARTGLPAGP